MYTILTANNNRTSLRINKLDAEHAVEVLEGRSNGVYQIEVNQMGQIKNTLSIICSCIVFIVLVIIPLAVLFGLLELIMEQDRWDRWN